MIAVMVGVVWGVVAGWLTMRQLCTASVRWQRPPLDGGDTAPSPVGPARQTSPGQADRSELSTPRPGAAAPGSTSKGHDRHPAPVGRLVSVVVWSSSAVGLVGRMVRGLGRRAPDPGADRRCGALVLLAGLLLAVHPVLALVPLVGVTVAPALLERRRARRHVARVVDELPDVVDLLRLTTSAGLPVTAALIAVGGRPGGVVGTALVRAGGQVSHGGTTADALATLHTTLGPPVRPLVDALADHDRYGTALAPALDRLAVETRLQRRRQAEEAARRLPVSLLFPLVLTVLPAYVLLTIVPLLAGSFSSLHL